MRIKNVGMDNQQLASEPSLKEKAMEHLCAACDRDECFKLMGMVNDRIEYLDRHDNAFKWLYGRTN